MRRERQAELMAMSYSEYRTTGEWLRKRHLFMRVFNQECQVCHQKGDGIDVYHLSLQNLGWERESELIILCDDCQEVLGKAGKLAVYHSKGWEKTR